MNDELVSWTCSLYCISVEKKGAVKKARPVRAFFFVQSTYQFKVGGVK